MAHIATPAPATIAPRDLALILTIQVVWGVNLIVAKFALAEIPPLAFTTLRFLLLSILLAAFMRWHRGMMGMIAIIALGSGAGHFGFMFLALSLAGDIAPIAIGLQLSVPLATLMSVIFLGERIGVWRVSAIALSFGGAALIAFDPRVAEYIIALGVIVLAALTWSFAALFMRRIEGVRPYDMQGWVALGTWPPLLIATLLFEPHAGDMVMAATWVGWGGLIFTIVGGTLIGHAGTFYLIQRYPIPMTAPFYLLAPALSAVLSVPILGDVLTWQMIVGGVLTLSGVLIITIREGMKKEAARADH